MNAVFQNVSEVKAALPQGKKFALVGGCFDLIHVGHLHVLEYAASLEEMLVVAVLSDAYARSYKGPDRPIVNERQRLRMVASLRCVDFAYLSDVSPNSPETLRLLGPDTVVFGDQPGNEANAQRRIETIRSSLPQARVLFLPRYNEEEVLSTSRIISKIKSPGT